MLMNNESMLHIKLLFTSVYSGRNPFCILAFPNFLDYQLENSINQN